MPHSHLHHHIPLTVNKPQGYGTQTRASNQPVAQTHFSSVKQYKPSKAVESEKVKDKKQKSSYNNENRLLDKYDKSNNKYTNLKIDKSRPNHPPMEQQHGLPK